MDALFQHDGDDPAPEEEEQSSGSWWGFVDKIKTTSQSLLGTYAEDLKEFTNTVKEDTKRVVKEVTEQQPQVAAAATTVSTTLSTGIASVTGGLSSLLKNVTEIVEDQLLPAIESGVDDSIDQGEPISPEEEEHFNTWMNEFNLDAHKEEIAKVINGNSQIADLYQQLVPSELTPHEFWGRYYYRLLKNQEKERMRMHLMEKAQNISEEDIKWDDDDIVILDTPAPVAEAATAETAPQSSIEEVSELQIESAPVIVDDSDEIALPATELEPVKEEVAPETVSTTENVEPVPVSSPINDPVVAPEPTEETNPVSEEPEVVQATSDAAVEPAATEIAAPEPAVEVPPVEEPQPEPVVPLTVEKVTEPVIAVSAPEEKAPEPVVVPSVEKKQETPAPAPAASAPSTPVAKAAEPRSISPVAVSPAPAHSSAASTPSRLAAPAEDEDVFDWE